MPSNFVVQTMIGCPEVSSPFWRKKRKPGSCCFGKLLLGGEMLGYARK